MSSLSTIAKGRIAYLLKRSRPKEFSKKRPKDSTANLLVLKQGSRQGHGISNPHRQRQEEKKEEESDEMNIDTSSANRGRREQNNRESKKYPHSRREDSALITIIGVKI